MPPPIAASNQVVVPLLARLLTPNLMVSQAQQRSSRQVQRPARTGH
jgi:hypothetical protein